MSARPHPMFRSASWPLLTLGGGLLVAAAFCFVEAQAHMVALGRICGAVDA
ncbi:MAG: hypothetical protein JSS35_13675, partial [Proteobacteria bacterium]|nr:hypothetical protein [Pseudomonadota bacterium]